VKTHEITIIGGGPGGYVAAIKAAQKGKDVALIEKEALGGVCLNWGCIPTKALLKSAKVYDTFKKAKSYGFTLDMDDVGMDFKKVMKRKDRAVRKLTTGVGHLMKKNGVEVYKGEASVKDARTVEVNDETITTDYLIIATGASPAVPPIEGIDEALENGSVVTSRGLLSIDSLPGSLAIIGGGVIGVEFATIFNTLGTDVTILEREEDILLTVDKEIRDAYKKELKKQKIKVISGAEVKKHEGGTLHYEHAGESRTLSSDLTLLSAGMKPNLEGLEALELEMGDNGIKTDAYSRTNLENVYAIGDVNGKLLLAHVASKEGVTAIEAIDGEARPLNYDHFPSGIYTFPEIAHVGLTEEEAKAQDIDYKVSTFPISANGRAVGEGQSAGLAKMIAKRPYDEVIGVHLFCENATELISESVLGMTLEASAEDIASAVHPHPTLSETVHEIAHGIVDKPIHI